MSTPPPTKGGASASRWQELYGLAVFELDRRKLMERIAEARCAIYDRAEILATDSASSERFALNSALRTLRLLEDIATRQSAA